MLQKTADWLTYELMLFAPGSASGSAVSFFLYDSAKVFLLLLGISWLMGLLNAYLPVGQIRAFLAEHRLGGMQYLLAAAFGALTPFCSCSSIPLFIGLVRGGIPVGVTLSFLITSPLVNEIAVAMFIGSFGGYITGLYVLSGILLGTLGGAMMARLHPETMLTEWARNSLSTKTPADRTPLSRPPDWRAVTAEALSIVRSVAAYIVIGIAVGALIHGYVPADFFSGILRGAEQWSVPAGVLCGIPLYANAAGIVPILEVLVDKGVPMGTALSFMMAVVGLSLPEAILLSKVMTRRLLVLYFGIIGGLIILSGYLFNLLT
ncbi:MAG: permease [Akkermansia sp.]